MLYDRNNQLDENIYTDNKVIVRTDVGFTEPINYERGIKKRETR